MKTGFEMLEHLSRHPRGQMLTEIAETLACPISSAYRIAVALENLGLVSREAETKQIRLKNKLLLIGQRAVTETNLVEHALDVMRELRDRVEDTVLIGVREGAEVIVLDEALGARMFAFISKLGFRINIFCSAPGKAILACLPEREREDVVAKIRFVKYSERTIMTNERLRRELVTVVNRRAWVIENIQHRTPNVEVTGPTSVSAIDFFSATNIQVIVPPRRID